VFYDFASLQRKSPTNAEERCGAFGVNGDSREVRNLRQSL
jgi:hypothetical protein